MQWQAPGGEGGAEKRRGQWRGPLYSSLYTLGWQWQQGSLGGTGIATATGSAMGTATSAMGTATH